MILKNIFGIANFWIDKPRGIDKIFIEFINCFWGFFKFNFKKVYYRYPEIRHFINAPFMKFLIRIKN